MPQVVSHPTLVAVDDALLDEPRLAVIEGTQPFAIAEVEATFTTWNGRAWRSEATFRADPQGRIDLATDDAIDGVGAGPMALVTHMRRVEGDAERVSVTVPRPLALRVRVGASTLQRVLIRRLTAAGVERVLVREGDVVGALYVPASGLAAPGVVVLGGSTGEPDYTTAALLASRGFAALAVAYFHAEGTSPHLHRVPLERVGRAAAWLRARTGRSFIAAWGTSRGAEAALAAAAHVGGLSAVVSVAGSGLRHAAVAPPDERDRATWTFRGRSLAFVEQHNPAAPPDEPSLDVTLDETTSHHEPCLTHAASVRRAAIPVERIAGPVLLAAGDDDRCWPSAKLSAIAAERRRRVGLSTELLIAPGAGHFLGPPYLPCTTDRYTHALTRRTYLAGGHPAADAAACRELWTRALAMLRAASG